jgi:hypothetical protein
MTGGRSRNPLNRMSDTSAPEHSGLFALLGESWKTHQTASGRVARRGEVDDVVDKVDAGEDGNV